MGKRKQIGTRKRRRALIAAVVLLACIILDLFVTKQVYDGIFTRYDEPALFSEEEFASAFAYTENGVFACGSNLLSSKLYAPKEPNGTLCVLVPGMRAGFSDLLPLTAELAMRGYTVFSFDPTGARGSGGDSGVGFYQTVYDLEACLSFIEENGLFGCEKLVVIGHSRGGYAACTAGCSAEGVSAVVSVSAPDSCMDAVIGSSSGFVGSAAAYANYPALWLYQARMFGPAKVGQRASRAVRKADIPVLIIHGADDDTVRPDAYSLYARAQKAGGNAELALLPGGHTDVIYEDDGTVSAVFLQTVCDFLAAATAGRSE